MLRMCVARTCTERDEAQGVHAAQEAGPADAAQRRPDPEGPRGKDGVRAKKVLAEELAIVLDDQQVSDQKSSRSADGTEVNECTQRPVASLLDKLGQCHKPPIVCVLHALDEQIQARGRDAAGQKKEPDTGDDAGVLERRREREHADTDVRVDEVREAAKPSRGHNAGSRAAV